MKIKYIVRTTTYCVDGSHVTRWVNFDTDLLSAKRFVALEKNRKLLLCDVRKSVRLLTVGA